MELPLYWGIYLSFPINVDIITYRYLIYCVILQSLHIWLPYVRGIVVYSHLSNLSIVIIFRVYVILKMVS